MFCVNCFHSKSRHFFDHASWLLASDNTVFVETAMEALATIIRQPHGLRYLSHSTELTNCILTLLLDHHGDDGAEELKKVENRRINLGSELSVRLETLCHVDALIDVVRKRGETGCQSYAEESINLKRTGDPRSDDVIFRCLFGLARLVVDPCECDSYGPWVADVIVSKTEDYFLPLLILLECFDRQEKLANSKTVDSGICTHPFFVLRFITIILVISSPSPLFSITLSPDPVIGFLVSASMSSNDGKSPQTPQSLLSRLDLSDDRLKVSALLSAVSIGVLRYAEDTQYLLRYGPRLLELVRRKYLSCH